MSREFEPSGPVPAFAPLAIIEHSPKRPLAGMPTDRARKEDPMTRLLVVYHDASVADIETDELRRAGFEVDRCAGPIGGNPCPVLNGGPCWQVDEADVLVYDTWEGGHHGPDMIANLQHFHPGKPVVLTSSRPAHVDFESDEADLIFHAPTRADLVPTIRRALEAAARQPPRPPATVPEHGIEIAIEGRRW
jgi:hypothetical protein